MSTKVISPLSNAETAAFCAQLSMILCSGISSVEGITIMLEDSTDAQEKELLRKINDSLLHQGFLYEALESTGAFPEYMVNMVNIGEQTGRLDNVMSSLGDYYEKEDSLGHAIKNAVTYPFLMILMMLLVILVLITKVMPVFDQVFKQLGSEMTGISLAILKCGESLTAHAPVFFSLVLLFAIFLFFLLKTDRGHRMLRSLIRHFRGGRTLAEQIASRRFANGMALTLSSGLPPQECLQLTLPLIDDPEFKKRLTACSQSVEEGNDLCQTLLEHHIFSGLYARIASIGSKTGSLDTVMEKIAGNYEEEIDNRLTDMIGMIEPVFVIILSIIVGIILLSVMLPLINIMAGL